MSKLERLVKNERGATAVEYGLIASLIVLAIIGGASEVADRTSRMWTFVANTVDEAVR